MESVVLLVVLVLLIMLGAPVGFTMILIPVVYILITDAAPMILIPSQMFSAIDSVPLTAIPFFMLTGELMTSATITDRLVELSQRLIGRMRGSMAQANVLVSMFFAGMNGSVVADTATVGSLMIPSMKKAGYPPAFAAAITAVSSTIGGIIPPSIMMIVLANAGGVTVSHLEWVQSRTGDYWDADTVRERMTRRMEDAARRCYEQAEAADSTVREAAYTLAIRRIAEAISSRGDRSYFCS